MILGAFGAPVERCEALAQGCPHNLAMLAEPRVARPARI
jgi:hypothetical protein